MEGNWPWKPATSWLAGLETMRAARPSLAVAAATTTWFTKGLFLHCNEGLGSSGPLVAAVVLPNPASAIKSTMRNNSIWLFFCPILHTIIYSFMKWKRKNSFHSNFYSQLKTFFSTKLQMETIRVSQIRTYVRAKTRKPKAGLYLFLNRMVNSQLFKLWAR